MNIQHLPTELSLLILNYVNYSDIIGLLLVSKYFNNLIKSNIQQIYELKSNQLITQTFLIKN